jgi:hypothetical protein
MPFSLGATSRSLWTTKAPWRTGALVLLSLIAPCMAQTTDPFQSAPGPAPDPFRSAPAAALSKPVSPPHPPISRREIEPTRETAVAPPAPRSDRAPELVAIPQPAPLPARAPAAASTPAPSAAAPPAQPAAPSAGAKCYVPERLPGPSTGGMDTRVYCEGPWGGLRAPEGYPAAQPVRAGPPAVPSPQQPVVAAPPAAAPSPQQAPAPSAGAKCFTFNNRQFCE